MGISRDSRHKRRATGGKQKAYRKKRKFELGRPAAMTKLGAKRIHPVRVRGGAIKYRALRLESGNYSWGSEAVTRKTRILNVVYNASNNELVRTNTLVKNSVVQVDATPFRQWYEQHYGVPLGTKKKAAAAAAAVAAPKKDEKAPEGKPAAAEADAPKKPSAHVKRKLAKRTKTRAIDPNVEEQFTGGRLYAVVASRPGQSGRADGYILEGRELDFYLKKIHEKKGKKASKKGKRPKVHYQYFHSKKKRARLEGEGAGGQKKEPQPRRRPGQVAMREIRHYQKTTEVLLRRLPFQRLVREVQLHIHDDPKFHGFRWKAEALHALQEAAEGFLVNLLEDCNLMALHTRRITIMVRDLQLVRRVRRLTFAGFDKPFA